LKVFCVYSIVALGCISDVSSTCADCQGLYNILSTCTILAHCILSGSHWWSI